MQPLIKLKNTLEFYLNRILTERISKITVIHPVSSFREQM